MKTTAVFLLLGLSFGLGACGQKGPLYLPQPAKPQPEVSAPQAVPEAAASSSAAATQAQTSSAAAPD